MRPLPPVAPTARHCVWRSTLGCCLTAVAAAQPPAGAALDREAIARELGEALAQRPADAPARATRDSLGRFLDRHRGQDLGPFGYAPALYLAGRRETTAAAARPAATAAVNARRQRVLSETPSAAT